MATKEQLRKLVRNDLDNIITNGATVDLSTILLPKHGYLTMNTKEFFAISDQYQTAKETMSDIIAGICGFEWVTNDITFDSYDFSFELMGVRNDFRLTVDQCVQLRDIGFDKLWLNHIDKTQTIYGLGGKRLYRSRKDPDGNFCGQGEAVEWPT
jgi:hypothetical protein